MRRALAFSSLVLAAGAGCSGTSHEVTAPTRTCGLSIWYRPASPAATVEVVSSWGGWSEPGEALAEAGGGWLAAHFDLGAGAYTYSLVVDGKKTTDPYVPTTAFHDGEEVTWVTVPDCDVPSLSVSSASGSATGDANIQASFLASRTGDPIAPSTFGAIDRAGLVLPASSITVNAPTGGITIAAHGLSAGKHVFTLSAKDTKGRPADEAFATVWIEPHPFAMEDTVIYQVVIDRYRNAGGPLAAPEDPAARAGGTVDGVRLAIESGEIPSLGVNTIWLSPLYKGPAGMFPGSGGHTYSDYHGYWPAAERELEPSQADDASLEALVAAAHARGIRILFDVVPNHVHQANSYWAEHKGEAWFNHPDRSCICGTTCDWATHIIDCWFTPYLPDLDWRNQAVADQLTSDVVWWMDRYDGDGIRIDAVPMMWRLATRRIVTAIRQRFDNPGHRSFLLGENFVGEQGYDQLRYELGPFGLDSEFQFPLVWTLRDVIAGGGSPMSDIDVTLQESQIDWGGSGAVMSLILGNQDMPRFASVSAGDGGLDGWTPAPQPTDATVYARQRLAFATIFALPGAPTIYYGDEVGLAGAGDPDSRRVMPGDSALSSEQLQTRSFVRQLGAARACSGALRRGSYRTLLADQEHLVFAREAEGVEPVIAVLMRSPGAAPLKTPLPSVKAGDYVDLLTGRHQYLSPELTIFKSETFSAALYVPATGTCASVAPR